MIKKSILLALTLIVSVKGFASPFLGPGDTVVDQKHCMHSEIYSSSSSTFLILNVVRDLSLKKRELSEAPKVTFQNAVVNALANCAPHAKMKISDVEYKSNVLSFVYGSGLQTVEWLTNGSAEYVVYKKTYGTYKDEPIMVVKYNSGEPVFTRVTGRLGAEQANTRYTFFYRGRESKASLQIELKNKNTKDIRSLKSIYGEDIEPVAPLIQIGVVGTGLDYNHIGLAKHLAYRPEIEDELQKLERLEFEIRKNPFVSALEYKKHSSVFENLKSKIGFPLWMDQALGTSKPLDSVIINRKVSRGGVREHETRVTSRIIRGGGPVEVHFARRSMGSVDILNVHEVVENFAKKGVKLVNLSFGSQCGGLPLEEKMWDEAFANHPEMIFVVSAGNSGLNTSDVSFCPAFYSQKYKNVISVTALGTDGDLAAYFETSVNFGDAVDLAIRADNLEVLIPYRKRLKWENNANGATSIAAAEVSRILTEAVVAGLSWSAQTVKEVLVSTSLKRPELKGVNKHSSEVDEWAFRAALRKGLRQ